MPSNHLGMIDINLLDLQQVKDLFEAAMSLLQKKDKEIRSLKEAVERKENEIEIKNKTIVDLIRRVDILEHNIKESKNGL